MAWRMNVDHAVRSPMFDFLLDDLVRLCVDSDGRAMKTGYRFEGAPPEGLAARQKDKKKLCDAFNIIGFMCVSRKFRDIVENLEPATHQFFPIALQAMDRTPYAEEHFIFNPCALIDAYLGVAGVAGWTKLASSGLPYITGFLQGTISIPEVAGRHVWVGSFLGRGNLQISEELYKCLEKAKVRYLWCRHLDESDAVWRPEEQMPEVMRWLEADPARIREMIETRPDWVRRHRPRWLN